MLTPHSLLLNIYLLYNQGIILSSIPSMIIIRLDEQNSFSYVLHVCRISWKWLLSGMYRASVWPTCIEHESDQHVVKIEERYKSLITNTLISLHLCLCWVIKNNFTINFIIRSNKYFIVEYWTLSSSLLRLENIEIKLRNSTMKSSKFSQL